MSGYFLPKNFFPSSSCSFIESFLSQYDGLKVRLSQNMHPSWPVSPSLLGQENPASMDIFCTLNGNFERIHVPKSL